LNVRWRVLGDGLELSRQLNAALGVRVYPEETICCTRQKDPRYTRFLAALVAILLKSREALGWGRWDRNGVSVGLESINDALQSVE